jgi:type II secretory pathway component GspD/PulD (secretin)
VLVDRAGGRLLVRATAEQHQAVAAALAVADAPVPNIRIELTVDDATTTRQTEAGVRGSGTVQIGTGGTSYDLRIQPQLSHQKGEQSTATRQQLLLRSGGEAQLFVGEEVPFQEWLIQYGRNWGYLESRTVIERVGAALSVQARVLGDGSGVAIRLVPELTGFVGGRRQRIAMTQAAVEVTGQSGQPLEIAAFGQHADLYNRYLAGIARSRSARQMRMVVVPTILPAAP